MALTPADAMKIFESVGLLTVKLAKDLYVVLVPVRVTTLSTINPDGFQPHEKKQEIQALRPLLIDLAHLPREGGCLADHWLDAGALVINRLDPDEIAEELLKLGFNIEDAVERRNRA